MPRPANPAFIEAIEQPQVDLFHTVEMHLEVVARMWTGIGDLTIDGELYYGLGNLLGIGGVQETNEVAARSVNFSISGVPSNMLSLALTNEYKGKILLWHLGTLDKNGEPIRDLIMGGEMDMMDIQDGEGSAVITLTVESHLTRLERAAVARYTDQNQRSRFTADPSLEFVNYLQDTAISWGAAGISVIDTTR